MKTSEIIKDIRDRYCNDCTADGCKSDCDEMDALNMALDLLEKKEQGLLIELPVPIGSEHYFIHPDKRRGIKKVKVVGCWKSSNDDCSELNIADVEGTFSYPIPFDDVKELLHDTRKDAEKRLEELRGE